MFLTSFFQGGGGVAVALFPAGVKINARREGGEHDTRPGGKRWQRNRRGRRLLQFTNTHSLFALCKTASSVFRFSPLKEMLKCFGFLFHKNEVFTQPNLSIILK